MSDLFNLTGKKAIITGSSKGIGKSIAKAMALHGAEVVISSRKADVCQETADEINEACKDGPGKAIVIPCNISDKAALEMLVEETRIQLGQIDILVCNAATNPFFGSIKDIPDEAFEKIMNNNIITLRKSLQRSFAKALWENPEILKSALTGTPQNRIGEPDELGGAAVFLASAAGSYVNGHTIVVDGGTTVYL